MKQITYTWTSIFISCSFIVAVRSCIPEMRIKNARLKKGVDKRNFTVAVRIWIPEIGCEGEGGGGCEALSLSLSLPHSLARAHARAHSLSL